MAAPNASGTRYTGYSACLSGLVRWLPEDVGVNGLAGQVRWLPEGVGVDGRAGQAQGAAPTGNTA
jgi:hypothetical protein